MIATLPSSMPGTVRPPSDAAITDGPVIMAHAITNFAPSSTGTQARRGPA